MRVETFNWQAFCCGKLGLQIWIFNCLRRLSPQTCRPTRISAPEILVYRKHESRKIEHRAPSWRHPPGPSPHRNSSKKIVRLTGALARLLVAIECRFVLVCYIWTGAVTSV
jgi:hypothetical protein